MMIIIIIMLPIKPFDDDDDECTHVHVALFRTAQLATCRWHLPVWSA
jgi:hypothetical protein